MMHIPICLAAFIYVLTGSPSSGKTSIIKELEKRGELVVHEAATDRIVSKIKQGESEPWKDQNFPLDILQVQLERERPWLNTDARVFIDRGILDPYAFARVYNLAGTQTLASMNKLVNQIDLNQRYKAIFFVMPHSANFSPLQTEVRRENADEAAQLEVAAYALYCRHNNFIVVPGEQSPEKRADFILKKIQEIESESIKKVKNSLPSQHQ